MTGIYLQGQVNVLHPIKHSFTQIQIYAYYDSTEFFLCIYCHVYVGTIITAYVKDRKFMRAQA